MKRFAAVTVASIVGLGLASGAFAQTQTPPRETQAPARSTFQKPADVVESKRLVGTRVKDAQHKDLGEIDQLLVDPQSGQITHAVIGVGGLMGIGETHVVVAWPDVKLGRDRDNADRWVVTMDKAELDRAPRFTAGDRERMPATSPRTEPGRAPSGAAPDSRTDRK